MKDNRHLKHYTLRIYMFYALLFALIIFFVYFPRITLPLGLAYILTLTLEPFKIFYFKAQARKRKWLVLSWCGAFVLALIPIIRLVGKITEELGKINQYTPKIEMFITSFFFKLQMFLLTNFKYRVEFDIAKTVSTKLAKGGQEVILSVPSLFGSLLEWFFLMPLFLYFFLREKQKAREFFFKLVPNSHFEKVYVLANQFNKKFGDYIVAKLLEATIVGVLIYTGLVIIHFPSPAFLAIFAAIMNILPYVGPLLGVVPAIFLVLIENDPSISGWSMIIVYAVANLIDMVLVFPLLVSKIVNLHPIIVVMSVIIGSQLGGMVGMIIAVPLTAFIKIMFHEIYKDTYPQG